MKPLLTHGHAFKHTLIQLKINIIEERITKNGQSRRASIFATVHSHATAGQRPKPLSLISQFSLACALTLHHPHKHALSPLTMRAGTCTHTPSRALSCGLSLHIHDTRVLGTTLVKGLVIAEPRHGAIGAQREKTTRQVPGKRKGAGRRRRKQASSC